MTSPSASLGSGTQLIVSTQTLVAFPKPHMLAMLKSKLQTLPLCGTSLLFSSFLRVQGLAVHAHAPL